MAALISALWVLTVTVTTPPGGDLVSQMRGALQHERSNRNENVITEGKLTWSLNLLLQDAFPLLGRRAIHMEDNLGSIQIGKLTELVIFDVNSPGMVCASEQDPVAAIVLHSSVRDIINTVIIDGRVRKWGEKVLSADLNPSFPEVPIPRQRVEGKKVAKELVPSRKRIEEVIKRSNADDSNDLVLKTVKMIYLDENRFVKL
ncbi:Metallo-dependent hydrolase [Penicillium diatomitis]|uniref:Metallo-dependent hydrolase n=1 Tax=Penicillium diatomitis TaxID=2819901 RepID=A0A9W9X2X2_9EURO|nr:Metallo-dependent hydrolase [Penicillium diatomitis]KAJ5481187.1 Metallo-dependent hydrolase [Penicillium diatomitis]